MPEEIAANSPTLQRDMGKVAILLCTYNGERFLEEQLASISHQTYLEWELWVSDDRSSDETMRIIEEFANKKGVEKVISRWGPGQNSTKNFLSLVHANDIDADFYAYADQDDVWESCKLSRALQWLKTIPENTPALYCSRTRLIDEKGNDIGYSPLFDKPPSFQNALVQSIAGGNTMVFNQAARSLLQKTDISTDIVLHDWWTYLVVTGCGGRVYYDRTPAIKYRQHSRNVIGAQIGWTARFFRIYRMLRGGFQQFTEANIIALCAIKEHLTPDNRKILEQFMAARKCHLLRRVVGLKKCRLYRQTTLGNVGLAVATILNII